MAIHADGSLDGARYGLALDEPALAGWPPEMQAALRECLTKRPSRAASEPPSAANNRASATPKAVTRSARCA